MPISKGHLKDIQASYQELEIQINRFLSVRTKNDRIVIYVNGKLFTQCKFLVMNVPKEDEKQEYINSIDEVEVLYGENQQLDLSLKDHP